LDFLVIAFFLLSLISQQVYYPERDVDL